MGSLNQARAHKRKFDAVITLQDPLCARNNRLIVHGGNTPARLTLEFEDADEEYGGVRVAKAEQVEEALQFARRYSSGSLLVHCFHGVGRSAAIALAVLAERLGEGAEQEAVSRLFALRPEATPNLVVTALADAVLGRHGALQGALAEWERNDARLQRLRGTRAAFLRRNLELYARG